MQSAPRTQMKSCANCVLRIINYKMALRRILWETWQIHFHSFVAFSTRTYIQRDKKYILLAGFHASARKFSDKFRRYYFLATEQKQLAIHAELLFHVNSYSWGPIFRQKVNRFKFICLKFWSIQWTMFSWQKFWMQRNTNNNNRRSWTLWFNCFPENDIKKISREMCPLMQIEMNTTTKKGERFTSCFIMYRIIWIDNQIIKWVQTRKWIYLYIDFNIN